MLNTWIGNILEDVSISPTFSTVTAAVIVMLWYLHRLRPESLERKRKNSSDEFDNFCDAYNAYKEDTSDGVSRAKLEFRGWEYCRSYYDHEILSVAFKTGNPMHFLNDLRQLESAIEKKDDKYQQSIKPYKLPPSQLNFWQKWSGLFWYVTFCSVVLTPLTLGSLGLLPAPIIIVSVSFSVVPFLLMISAIQENTRLKRLARIADKISEHYPILR